MCLAVILRGGCFGITVEIVFTTSTENLIESALNGIVFLLSLKGVPECSGQPFQDVIGDP